MSILSNYIKVMQKIKKGDSSAIAIFGDLGSSGIEAMFYDGRPHLISSMFRRISLHIFALSSDANAIWSRYFHGEERLVLILGTLKGLHDPRNSRCGNGWRLMKKPHAAPPRSLG